MQKHGSQLLAVAVAGSCLPISIVKDNNVKRWVKFIAPLASFFENSHFLVDNPFLFSISCLATRRSVSKLERSPRS